MQPGLGSAVFLAVMLGASGLTMVRMALVAGLLPTADFARYATITASGAFLATLVSFGAVEQTIKGFPRAVEDGRAHEMRARCLRIFVLIGGRALIIGLPLLLAGLMLRIDWLRDFGIAAVYALSVAGMALVASIQRAMSDSRKLALGTLLRTATVLVGVVIAAMFAGLGAVLAVEIAATAAVCLASVALFVPAARAAPASTGASLPTPAEASGGLALFIAFSAINVPFYLDRAYVSAVFGDEVAGRYAVLALFLTAAALLVNILAQRIGPDAIRLVHREGSARSAVRHLTLWIGLCTGFWLAAIGAAAFLFTRPEMPAAIARYAIEPRMLAPIAVSGVLLNTALLEFLLIALDRERKLLRAALGFLAVSIGIALAIALTGAGLLTLMWAMAASRVVYAGLLIGALRSALATHKGTSSERALDVLADGGSASL